MEAAERNGYHLLLAGHTHGGQIVHNQFIKAWTPNLFESRYFRGIDHYKNLKVVITNGIGLTLAPVRYHAPAEITQLILKRKG